MKNRTIIKITYCALLIALDVLLSRVLAINTPVMKIGLGFIAVALSGALFGPAWGAAAGALGDILGAVLFPTGAYFPGFTATAAISGALFGLLLKNYTKKKAVIAGAVNVTAVTYFMNSFLIAYISGTAYSAMLITRLPQLAIMLAIEILIFTTVFPKLVNLIKGKNF